MRRTIFLAGVLPFVSAFLGGVLAFSLVAAPQATAQSSQVQKVRASAFTLVGTDGTVLARLAPAETTSGERELGILTLYGVTGVQVRSDEASAATTIVRRRHERGGLREHPVGGT